jgi:hypothetical protein
MQEHKRSSILAFKRSYGESEVATKAATEFHLKADQVASSSNGQDANLGIVSVIIVLCFLPADVWFFFYISGIGAECLEVR